MAVDDDVDDHAASERVRADIIDSSRLVEGENGFEVEGQHAANLGLPFAVRFVTANFLAAVRFRFRSSFLRSAGTVVSLCEGWTRCKGCTRCQAWTAAKAGPFARVGPAAEVPAAKKGPAARTGPAVNVQPAARLAPAFHLSRAPHSS